MVTSIPSMTSPPPTYSTEHEVFVENSRVAIEQPLICVDGLILACRFDGERCTPTFAIGIADLLKAVRTELETLKVRGIFLLWGIFYQISLKSFHGKKEQPRFPQNQK